MKRYLAEFIGTLFLAMAVNLVGDSMAIGLMFMAMVYILGPISGCHINPAVSLTLFFHKKMSVGQMLSYMLAQVMGACAFALLAFGIFGAVIPTRIVPMDALFGAASFELLLTLILCVMFLVVSSCDRFKDSHVNGIVLGLTLAG